MTLILSKRHQHTLAWVFLDMLVVFVAYSIAFAARAVSTPLDYLQSVGYILICAVFTIGMLLAFGIYQRIWSRTSGHGITVIVKAVAATTLFVTISCLTLVPR